MIGEFGWVPVGIEVSADQLRLVRHHSTRLVRGDAEHLPFSLASVAMAVSSWTSTDVDDFARMMSEVERVLVSDGRFLFYGVHPCFNGPHVQEGPERSRLVHPSYRRAERHTSAPWWGRDVIRTKVGGMRPVPLAEFINAFIDSGLTVTRVSEPDEEPVPWAIVVHASKAAR